MITLDTSGLFAYINRDDPFNAEAEAVLKDDPGPWLVPAAILAEIAWIIESRIRLAKASRQLLADFLYDLESGAYSLDCGEMDFPRIRHLLDRYADLGLDFPDAAVIACAERHRGRTLTTDRRDFDIVARGEKTITILPTWS